jgi:hypothetical protein
VIGAVAVPARLKTWSWVYVPALTRARWPAWSEFSAFWTVRHGANSVPGLVSLPVAAT